MIDPEEFIKRKGTLTYPYVYVEKPTLALPAIIQNLEKGGIPVVVEYKGKRKIVTRISSSAMNVDNLLRCIGSFTYVVDENKSILIKCIEDYLENF